MHSVIKSGAIKGILVYMQTCQVLLRQSHIMLFNTVMPVKKEKTEPFSKYYIHYYVVLVTYSNCLAWNLSKEQTIINLSAMILLKVFLYLILFITVSWHYK